MSPFRRGEVKVSRSRVSSFPARILSFKKNNPSDPQSFARSVWQRFPEQTTADANWPRSNKGYDSVPPQVTRHPGGCVRRDEMRNR